MSSLPIEEALRYLDPEEQAELLNLVEDVSDEAEKQEARDSYLKFMQYCWRKSEPFVVGLHTRIICAKIDVALENFRNGISTYIRIKVHPRAGKSDIVSRNLPARFIAEFPDCDVMAVSYNKAKAEGFARNGMKLIKSRTFKELFSNVELNRGAAGNWSVSTVDMETNKLEEREGQVLACGINSGLNGDGAHLAILDDYCSGRAEAESSGWRDTVWHAFTNDFLTRLAPVHIVIILATQWNSDDIHGRLEKRNDPEDEDYAADFYKFETLSFPARRETAEKWLADQYPGEYLFLERLSEEYYKAAYAGMTTYQSSALMDCDPIPRDGGILNTAHIVYHETLGDFPEISYVRVWDYAHTAKNRTGADPDYTGGTLLGFERGARNPATNQYSWKLWVLHYTEFREGAVKRDQKIRKIADDDGVLVKILVETSLDSKDGYVYLKHQLGGIFSVLPVNPRGDKVQRCTPLEPIFEAGNVHVLRAPWNKTWVNGIQRFDGSGKTHDEMVDNITAGYEYYSHAVKTTGRKIVYGRT